jgi:hypothetical protein
MMNSAGESFHALSGAAPSLSPLLDPQLVLHHGLSGPGAAFVDSLSEFHSVSVLSDSCEVGTSSLQHDGLTQALEAFSQNLTASTAGTTFAAAAAATPAFNPATFKINPSSLGTAVTQIVAAIEQGYSAASAITLLEKDSVAVNVSPDDMLELTYADLKTQSGSAVVAAETAFVSAMKTRLAAGAESSLAGLVHAGHLTAAAANGFLLTESKDAVQTVNQEAHAIALLINDFVLDKVAEAQIQAVAKADAAVIIAGVEKQIALGGSSAPTGVDFSAAAQVYESGLPKAYTAAAFNAVQKQFAGFDTTGTGVADLNWIESTALKQALADKQITQAVDTSWATAFAAAQNGAEWAAIDSLAAKFAAGTISTTVAANDLKAWGPTQASAAALLLGAAKQKISNAIAIDLAELAIDGNLYGSVVASSGLVGVLRQLVADVIATTGVTGVDAKSLIQVLDRAINFGAYTGAQAAALVNQAAAKDQADGPDAWLDKMANDLGDPSTADNTGFGSIFLSVANDMAARVKSGAFQSGVIQEYASGKLSLGSADAYIEAYAHLAMANNYSVAAQNRLTDPELTQLDGVSSDDRIGYELVQFIKDAPKADTTAVTNYVEMNNTLFYLTGLGFTAGMGNDKTMAADLLLADKVIAAADMAGVAAAGKYSGSGSVGGTPVTTANEAIYEAASSDAASAAQAFANGLYSYMDDATAISSAPSGSSANPFGSLLQDVKDIATNPGNFSNFENLAVVGLGDVINKANPLKEELSLINNGGDAVKFFLDKTGLGTLLGPVGTGLEGAINFVQSGTGALTTALDGFLAAPAVDMIFGVGKTLYDLGAGLGDFAADFFTGNFSGAGQVAQAMGTEFANDLGNIETQVATDMINTAYALANQIADIAQQLVNGVEDIVNIFTSAADSVENAFDDAWAGIESIY